MPDGYVSQSPYSSIDPRECVWYHAYDFNNGAEGVGAPHYDLVPVLDKFLLPERMEGKTFLDIGTASGFFSFEMERRGGQVVSFDLDGVREQNDQIPYANAPDRTEDNRRYVERLQKSYWYAHGRLGSKARAVYGRVTDIPDWLGRFDVTLLGSILQHLRDPLGAIIEADRHTKDVLIISEAFYPQDAPVICFQANPDSPRPQYWTWWKLSPQFLVAALKSLGYRRIDVCGPFDLFNIEGNYTVPTVTVRGSKASPGPLLGFTLCEASGFSDLEPGFAELGHAGAVRWMVEPRAELRFWHAGERDGPFSLRVKARSLAAPQQLDTELNGVPVLNGSFLSAERWEEWTVGPLTVRPGENQLILRAEHSVSCPGDPRRLHVLFGEITIDAATGFDAC